MLRIDLLCYVLSALLAFLGIIIAYGIVQRFCDSGNEPVGVLCGMATLLLVGLCSISIWHIGNTATKIEDDIKSSLNKNYPGYTNYRRTLLYVMERNTASIMIAIQIHWSYSMKLVL